MTRSLAALCFLLCVASAAFGGVDGPAAGTAAEAEGAPPPAKEMLLRVKVRRRGSASAAASTSTTELRRDDIRALPQGEQIRLPKLIAITTPGVVPGAFGQLFFRGNHANIQYQIDGVQLPESLSGTFGDAFAPRNIERMEILTGGIPAEYGQRLSAVVNIVTRKGAEEFGGTAELNYGSYNFFSPTVTAGGSAGDGTVHYFFSGNFNRTDRALDTPQPTGPADVTTGSSESVHNLANGHNEFGRVDWTVGNEDKLSFILFNSYSDLQIPNFPGRFRPSDSIFTAGDSFGNDPYLYRPAGTDDRQHEQSAYLQAIWRHTLSERSFLQLAPYWKYGYVGVKNDPANDLAGASLVVFPNPADAPVYASYAQSRNVNNLGVKLDCTWRPSDRHVVKTGVQLQSSKARGTFSIVTAQQGQPNGSFSDRSPSEGTLESVYVQDDWTIADALVLKAGLRLDGAQFSFGGGGGSSDHLLQPRVGLSWRFTSTSKLHVFYGKLFQPAPAENLRAAFNALSPPPPGQTLPPYDIKAEKADYYEAGLTQELPFDHVVSLTAYRKNAQNILDDAQLFNTAILQPINFATGYVYGAELSVHGSFLEGLTHYANYSYSVGRGKGLSGGLFTGVTASPDYQYLDHQQFNTINAGVAYKTERYWLTAQALYGSGLRTGPGNGRGLPSHLTFDATVGYTIHKGLKVSLDVLNLTDNRYPVTLANGFNGSHYAAGRQVIGHLVLEL